MEINIQLLRNVHAIPKLIPPTITKHPIDDHGNYKVRKEIYFYCFT